MAALRVFLLLMTSLPLLHSDLNCTEQYKLAFKSMFDAPTKRCKTKWGIFNNGTLIHKVKFHGETHLTCTDTGVDISQDSYYLMDDVNVTASGKQMKVPCGVALYKGKIISGTNGEQILILSVCRDNYKCRYNDKCWELGNHVMKTESWAHKICICGWDAYFTCYGPIGKTRKNLTIKGRN